MQLEWSDKCVRMREDENIKDAYMHILNHTGYICFIIHHCVFSGSSFTGWHWLARCRGETQTNTNTNTNTDRSTNTKKKIFRKFIHRLTRAGQVPGCKWKCDKCSDKCQTRAEQIPNPLTIPQSVCKQMVTFNSEVFIKTMAIHSLLKRENVVLRLMV